jgi:hypothetical protein
MIKSVPAAALCCLLLLPASAAAQTRSRRTTTTPQKRRTAPAQPGVVNSDVNAARIKLSDQVKNLSRFLYLYGRFSKDLEQVSAQAESSQVAQQTKAALLGNFRNLREGLGQLEAQFRSTRGLERPYQLIQGVARRVEDAEQQASAGQYDRAGRALVDVVAQLTDVLLEM